MALFENDLIVFHDDNSVFTDFSLEASDYKRDPFKIELSSTQDYLYAGLYKPFGFIYFEPKVSNTVSNVLTAEFFDGTDFVSLANFLDRSKGFTRAGFIEWKRNQTDWEKTTINGEELFWIRFRPNADLSQSSAISTAGGSNTGNGTVGTFVFTAETVSDTITLTATSATSFTVSSALNGSLGTATVGGAFLASNDQIGFTIVAGGTPFISGDTFSLAVTAGTVFQGLNTVFNDDNELKAEFSSISDLLGANRTSFVALHEASRDEIIQKIRNTGLIKFSNRSSDFENYTKWDVLDREEIEQASKFLALSKIFFEISDNPEDKWYQRYKDNRGLFRQAFDLFFIRLDQDDDGIRDRHEREDFKKGQIFRV